MEKVPKQPKELDKIPPLLPFENDPEACAVLVNALRLARNRSGRNAVGAKVLYALLLKRKPEYHSSLTANALDNRMRSIAASKTATADAVRERYSAYLELRTTRDLIEKTGTEVELTLGQVIKEISSRASKESVATKQRTIARASSLPTDSADKDQGLPPITEQPALPLGWRANPLAVALAVILHRRKADPQTITDALAQEYNSDMTKADVDAFFKENIQKMPGELVREFVDFPTNQIEEILLKADKFKKDL
jgi:hypothetical protein